MFKNQRTTKKGECGEQIIKQLLINNGWNVAHFEGNGAHCVDFIAHKIGNKHRWFTFEVKTKPIKPPFKTTGFNKSSKTTPAEIFSG